jgi:hypothetical protein
LVYVQPLAAVLADGEEDGDALAEVAPASVAEDVGDEAASVLSSPPRALAS